jgi:hypothetical protein
MKPIPEVHSQPGPLMPTTRSVEHVFGQGFLLRGDRVMVAAVAQLMEVTARL